MKKINGNKAITLIALVITIIVLIILAGVTVSLVLGNNGIIIKTSSAKEQNTIESIKEKLELVKASDYVKKEGSSSIDTYFVTLEKEKIEPYIVTNKEKMTETTAIVEVDNKYSFLITIESKNGINIKYEGKIEEIDRTEPIIEIAISGDSIQSELPIKLTATVTSNGESIEQAKCILNISSEELGTEENNYIQTVNEDIKLEINEINTYYLHTLTIDNYGRKQETIKGPIIIEEKYHEHTENSTTGGGCYTNAIYHKHDSNCYTTTSQSYQAGIRYEGNTYGDGTWYRTGYCTDCGTQLFIAGSSGGWGTDSPHTHYRNVQTLTCKKTENVTIDSYSLGCEKTTSTLENYSVTIGNIE